MSKAFFNEKKQYDLTEDPQILFEKSQEHLVLNQKHLKDK